VIQLAPSLLEFELEACPVPPDEMVADDRRTYDRRHGRGRPPRPGGGVTTPAAVRTSQLSLAAVPTAVGCARLFVRTVLEQWRLARLVDTAELLASELVTHSVTAAGGANPPASGGLLADVSLIQVKLTQVADDLVVSVWDRDMRPPEVPEADPGAPGGRGMQLVQRMSKRWGYQFLETGGRIIWCVVGAMTHATSCGLPIRMPPVLPAPRTEIEDDPVLLRRVIEQLRRI
jgi:hypothetical protein